MTPARSFRFISQEVQQIDKLFNLKTEFGLRNWCIVHLMLDAGLRSSEVINLRFCDHYV